MTLGIGSIDNVKQRFAIVTLDNEKTRKFQFYDLEILQYIHSELIKSNKSNMEKIIKNSILNNLSNKL